MDDAKIEWSRGHDQPPPPHPVDMCQKAWDIPRVQETYDTLLEGASDPRSRARLLAVATRESGAWLKTLPISSLGLRMDNDVVRTAVGVRLGVPLCRHCRQEVDELATHGLSCIKSEGCHPCHAAINSIIQRSLAAAQIPSTLEPTGLIGSNGQCSDGVTIAPWKSRQPLVWDATCSDTYAASYVVQSTREARAVAELAEIKKDKYLTIARTHHFVPVVVETSGAFGPDALQLFADIARRIRAVTREIKSRAYLFQRVSVALQQGNAAAVLGTARMDIFD